MKLRPYHASDLPHVLTFIGRCLRHDALKNYHPGDVVHWMSNGQRGADLDKHFWLYEEAGELLAFAELPPAKWASFALIVHPERRGGDLETELLAECEAVMRERVQGNNSGRVGLSVNVVTSDEARRRCLSRLGYQARVSTTAVSARPLSVPIPAPDLPAGFGLRGAAGDHEAALLAEVHAAAFGSSWTAEDYLKVLRTPGFEPQRELVVTAPDGRFAAFLVYWLDPVSRSGLFEPVGCHPDFRRRGLIRALMYEAMRCMAAANLTTALVGYDVTNEAAARLYASVGFAAHFRTLDYTKGL